MPKLVNMTNTAKYESNMFKQLRHEFFISKNWLYPKQIIFSK